MGHLRVPSSEIHDHWSEQTLIATRAPLLSLLDAILDFSALLVENMTTSASSRATTPVDSQSHSKKATLCKGSKVRATSTTSKEEDWTRDFKRFEIELGRLALWETDVEEAELEVTLFEESPLHGTVRQSLEKICDIVTRWPPEDVLAGPDIRHALAAIERVRRGTRRDGSTPPSPHQHHDRSRCSSPCPHAQRSTTPVPASAEDLAEQDMHGLLKQEVDSLFELWDFMELAQPKMTLQSLARSASTSSKRKRRGSSVPYPDEDVFRPSPKRERLGLGLDGL